MSKSLMRRYIDILLESAIYTTLNDAGPSYSPGQTQIWYWKENLGHEMMKGVEYLKRAHLFPNINNLERTHVLIGSIAETDPEKIFSLMQAESWSPQDQARSMIEKLRVGHVSMTTGDIIVSQNKIVIRDKKAFVNLNPGDPTNAAQFTI